MEEKIRQKIEKPLEEIGVTVDSISLTEEEGEKTLLIKIDSDKEVDINLCVESTNIINPLIDELDLNIDCNYVLDVCSKGEEEDGQ